MRRLLIHSLFAIILVYKVMSVPTTQMSEVQQDEEDDDWDDEDESTEVDDDGRIYKNPRNSPSLECPRDEEQATLLGQKCLRKCSSDEDCKSKKKKCLCDGVCGMSCIKPDRECPELAQPSLGQVSVAGRHFGARASYSCPHGYHVVGLQSRLCQADGNWAGAEPACKQNIYCLKPPLIEHARHSALPEQETFDLDSTVQYHCYNGYVTNGFPRAKCLAIDGQASWYGPDIHCEPRSCGQPPDPAYGWHAGECYTFGCKITYNCGTGYELVGKHERYCQSDGSWVPKELPTCVLVTSVICPTPENPKNGKATYTTLAYNSVVSYECRYGYTLVGDSSSRCGADRKWSGTLPSCKEINCGHPGVLYNGWIENIEAGTGLGASIIFRCQTEMLIRGQSSSVCQIDGRWRNPLPECLAPCVVPTISQGYVVPIEIVTDENGTTIIGPPTQAPNTTTTTLYGVEKVKHGTALEVKCDMNYEFPVSLLSPPICNNGTWSIIPRCVPARCKSMPKPPKHGMVLAPKTEHGMRSRFKCKDGYKLISPEGKDITDPNDYVLTCSFGNWTGETPMCQEVFCSFPGYIPHGKVLLVGNMGLYDYRPYVKKIANNKQIMYECDKGYVLEIGPPGATCVGGKWRPLELPQCLLGQHPRLRWNRRRRRRRSIEMRMLRSIYLLRNKRSTQRKLRDYLNDEQTLTGSEVSDTSRQFEYKKRTKRNPSEIDQAYSKFYQRIKQKYDIYVKNLLGYGRNYNPHEFQSPTKSIQVQDGRWHNSHNNPDLLTRFKATHKSRTLANDFSNIGDYDDEPEHDYDLLASHGIVAKIPLPNINSNSRYSPHRNFANDAIQNTATTMVNDNNPFNFFLNNVRNRTTKSNNNNESSSSTTTDKIQQLKSQIVRRRRKRDVQSQTANYEDDNDDASEPVESNEEDSKKTLGNGCWDIGDYYDEREHKFELSFPRSFGPKPPFSYLIPNYGRYLKYIQRYDNNPYNFFTSKLHIRKKINKNNESSNTTTDNIQQINSRIVQHRRKRDAHSQSSNGDDDASEPIESREGRKRLRGPCEELDWDSFANISVIRQGKAPGRNSVGIILHLECNAGFKLNIKGENVTARCIRGIWKPETPKCISAPCLVPVVEHGRYYKVEPHTKILTDTPSLTPLTTYEEIQSNEFITLECEDGFSIQGSAQLRCAHGSWSVNAFSECVSVPCTLPNIPGIIYEGGYRAGLTIGHGGTIMAHCDHPNATPVEMSCNKGALTPQRVICEPGTRKSREELYEKNSTSSGDSHDKHGPSIAASSSSMHSSKISILSTPVYEQSHKEMISHESEEATNTTEDVIADDTKMCGPPSIMDGALVYKNGDLDVEGAYESGTEIFFNCIPSAIGERMTWKIICDNGQWIGRSYNCENGTCLFKNNEPNVVSFYNDLEIREDTVEFPPGATIISRCTDIGKFSMMGSNERTCIHSEFTGTKPTCSGLNQENDYAMEKAPTILFRHQNGPIAQSNDGKLIVYPGTTLHMECLWMRRFGNPKWTVSHDFRNYSEGWVTEADEGRDSSLEYRLSIFNAVVEDSGTYACQTPARHEHSVEVVVKAISCPEIPTRRGLIVNTNDTKLSTRAQLSCANGNSLIGAGELICLPSGNWSSPLPVCESVECGDIPLPNNISSPRVSVLSREVGGRAAFSCSSGYGLRGPSEATCLPSGEWSTPFPSCMEVQCDNPGAPVNGYAQGSAPYRAGDVVQFNCNPEYMMQGQPIIACQDNGRWSGGLPKCVQACSYPGTAISGRMSSVKFYYAIGESITFTCDAGLELRGAKTLRCMKNGKWSNAIPTCISTDQLNSNG